MSILKVALPSSDVKTRNITEVAVTSEFSAPKINVKANPPHAGVIDVNWKTTGLSFANRESRILYSFSHNYNHIPSVIGTFRYDDGLLKKQGTLPTLVGILGVIVLESTPTSINLVYYSIDSTATAVTPFTLQVRFNVFAERGHE